MYLGLGYRFMQCALFFLLLLNPDLDYIANTICLGFNLVHLKEWWRNSKKLFQFSKFFRKYFCNIQVKIAQFWKMQIANKDQVKVKKNLCITFTSESFVDVMKFSPCPGETSKLVTVLCLPKTIFLISVPSMTSK